MSEEKFNCENVSFETKSTGNGTILKCVDPDENVELVSTWFAREEDASKWKSFLEYMANAVVHSVQFTEEQRDTLIAERDDYKMRYKSLLSVVQSSVDQMFEAIAVEEPTAAPVIDKPIVIERTKLNINSLGVFDQALYYKILGYNNRDANSKVKGLAGALLNSDNIKFSMLGTEEDLHFVNIFGRALFDSNSYVSRNVRKHAKKIMRRLSVKVDDIAEDLKEHSVVEVAESLKVHPAYVWALCVSFEIPFVIEESE